MCLIRTASTSCASAIEHFLLFLGELSHSDLALKLNVTSLLRLICQLEAFVACHFGSYTLSVALGKEKKKDEMEMRVFSIITFGYARDRAHLHVFLNRFLVKLDLSVTLQVYRNQSLMFDNM